MRIGIFAKTFVRPTLAATLDAVVAHGLDTVQFNLSCAGLPTLPDQIEPAAAEEIRAALAARRIEMAAISGTVNLIHPDVHIRQAGLRRLGVLIAACGQLGTQHCHPLHRHARPGEHVAPSPGQRHPRGLGRSSGGAGSGVAGGGAPWRRFGGGAGGCQRRGLCPQGPAAVGHASLAVLENRHGRRQLRPETCGTATQTTTPGAISARCSVPCSPCSFPSMSWTLPARPDCCWTPSARRP